LVQLLGAIPAARQVKDSFDPPAGLKTGDYVKGLDKFCGDTYNTKIALANALGFVSATLTGAVSPDEKILAHLRCLGAAGADSDRVSDCYKRQ